MTAPNPGARRSVGAAVWRGCLHVFGGFGVNGTVGADDIGDDLWRYRDGWEKLTSGGPPAARYPSLLATADAILSFGGCGYADGAMTFHNALWAFDGRWRRIETGGAAPEPRYTCALAGNAAALFMFGGNSLGPGDWIYHGDLWRCADGSWQKLHGPEEGPGPRYGFGWVATAESLYVFGGFDGVRDRDDFWMLDLKSLAWTKLPGGPPARYCPALGCVDGRIVLFGGRSKVNPKLNLDDTWVFDGQWRMAGTPGPGYHAKPAYAGDGTCLWLYGGEGPRGHVSDLWKYEEEGWQCVLPARDDDPILW